VRSNQAFLAAEISPKERATRLPLDVLGKAALTD
jgi:hypothetical protein